MTPQTTVTANSDAGSPIIYPAAPANTPASTPFDDTSAGSNEALGPDSSFINARLASMAFSSPASSTSSVDSDGEIPLLFSTQGKAPPTVKTNTN